MHRYFEDDSHPRLPARVQAALDFLQHCERITDQCDASIPRRDLSSLERSVQSSALSLLNRYFLGEMDYGDSAPRSSDTDRPHDGLETTPH